MKRNVCCLFAEITAVTAVVHSAIAAVPSPPEQHLFDLEPQNRPQLYLPGARRQLIGGFKVRPPSALESPAEAEFGNRYYVLHDPEN